MYVNAGTSMFTTKTYACLWTPLTFFVCSLVTVATATTTNATTVVSEFWLVKDPFYQEIEVSRGIPVILNWPSTQHPVDITIEKASVTWPYTNGSYALPDFIVSLNTTRLQTTFTVSQIFNGSLYYFCRNHKAMGVNKITILDANKTTTNATQNIVAGTPNANSTSTTLVTPVPSLGTTNTSTSTSAQTISTAPAQTMSSSTWTPIPTLDTVQFWQVDANAVKVTTSSGTWWLLFVFVLILPSMLVVAVMYNYCGSTSLLTSAHNPHDVEDNPQQYLLDSAPASVH